MQPDVNVSAAAVATGNVTLADRDTITSLTYGGTFTHGNGDSIGTSTHASLTNVARSTSVTFPTATQTITLNSGQSQTLNPGSYVSVTANSGATLTLLAGDYYFGALYLYASSTLKLSPTQGATRIFVSSTLTYQPTLGSGADPSRLFLEYLGTAAVVLETPFLGSIVAPYAYLTIATANGLTHRGTFMAQSLEVQPNASLAFVAFNPSGTISSCAAGTWDPDGNPFTPCVAKTTCAPGTYVLSEGTTTSDRTCAACTSGQFSNVNNAASCAAWRTCQAGTYVSNTPSSTVDRVCTACPTGQYSSGINQSQCLPQGSCAAGTVQTAAGTSTSATVCTACVAGQYCAGGTNPQTTCVAGTWDNDGNPATVCAGKTTCLPGTHVASEGTTTMDRSCAACASGSFSTTSNTASCTTWTTCLAGSYVTNAPSTTADRTCAACPAGQFSVSNNQASCQPQGTCAAGSVQVSSGSSTSATVCQGCAAGQYCAGGTAEPLACASGTWDNDQSAATPCVAKTLCLPGTFVGSEGSATSDRACTACVSGSWSAATNATACAMWSTCPAGTFVGNTPSATVDRVCSPCPGGQYSSGSNQSSCLPQGSCAAGTVQTAAGTATSPAVCQACVAGQYCAGGTSPTTACGDGTWDSDGDPATACAAVSVCAPGTRVLAEATATTDRTCQACDGGTFSTAANASSCVPWASCDPGTYVANAPSATVNRACSDCEAGKYSSGQNSAACTAWSTCSAGSYVTNAPSATADRACSPCQADQYSSGDNQSSCLSQGVCSAGTVEVTAGTSTSATVCNACLPGEYCAGDTNPELACASGTWDQDGDPATACVLKSVCPAGTFLANEGSTTTDRSCTACGSEQFSSAPNAVSCTPWATCPAGTFVSNLPSATVDRVCTPCDANTFSSTTNAAACTPVSVCSAGTFVSAPASSSSDAVCTACAPGTFNNSTNSVACQPCACSDGLACTTATCNSVGTCTYAPKPGNCVIDGACYADGETNPASSCQRCTASVSQTSWNTKADGASCNDGNACTQSDTCNAGICTGGNPVVCGASDQCHASGICDPANGQCSNPAKADGSVCNDGNGCTQTDTCQAGACTGSNPVTCVASDQCHVAGICDPANGACSNPPSPNGSACNDGSACTQTDQCQSGICVGSNPVTCTVLDQCHAVGTCDPASGTCSNPPKANGSACNDGNGCTKTDQCQAGVCVGGTPVTCTASDQCHAAGTCDPGTGACSNPAKADGSACDDGNRCTTGDKCSAGVCATGQPVVCTATDACHLAGTCNPTTGACSNPNAPNGTTCNDGNACSKTDQCQSGTCVGSNPVACLAPDQCHQAGTCQPSTGACTYPVKANGTACNDGNPCTQTDACQAGICQGGNLKTCPQGNQCQGAGQCDSGSGNCLFPGKADGVACDDGDATTSSDACHAGVCVGVPALPAPTVTNLASSLSFLYQGAGASQTGVPTGTIQSYRAAGISGHVFDNSGVPVMGATVKVAGHTEFGQSLTRADGGYDLAVNGGGILTVTLGKSGYLPVERPVQVPWQGFGQVPDVVMLTIDARTSTIDLTQQVQQVAVGSVSTDADGTRQAVLVVPSGVQALMDMPDGSTVALNTLNIHITEVTQGSAGPAAMPAPLPPNTQYTYAVDYSTDEGLAASAKSVRFSQPIYHYMENFLGFAVGSGIPAGYYDASNHRWVPSPGGAVVKILSLQNGMAQLDVDGSGSPVSDVGLQAMNITTSELAYLAQRYQPGQTLWRVPVAHFTVWDFNRGGSPPPGAGPPSGGAISSSDGAGCTDSCCAPAGSNPSDGSSGGGPAGGPERLNGSIIETQRQILGERVAIVGTPFSLNYRSNRTEGFKAADELLVSLSGASLPASVTNIRLNIALAGQKFEEAFAPGPNLGYRLLWDGKDNLGRPVIGRQTATVRIGYDYPLLYSTPPDGQWHAMITFGTFPSSATLTGPPGRTVMTAWQELAPSDTTVGTYLAKGAGLGGWTIDANHFYDPSGTLWRGDGEREQSPVSRATETLLITSRAVPDAVHLSPASDGTFYYTDSNGWGPNAPNQPPFQGEIWKYNPKTKNHTILYSTSISHTPETAGRQTRN